MIKLGPLFVALAALAARGVAADVKPVFEFIQRESLAMKYYTRGPHVDCDRS